MTQQKLSSYHVEKIEKLASDLMCAFDWHSSPEGSGFWCDIHKDLCDRSKHGTTDGKPWVEPELTDEDAKQRPWVMVRDAITQDWKGPLILIGRLPNSNYVCRVSNVSVWSHCRPATPEEIEAANADRQ
jgi:hypothetical protein